MRCGKHARERTRARAKPRARREEEQQDQNVARHGLFREKGGRVEPRNARTARKEARWTRENTHLRGRGPSHRVPDEAPHPSIGGRSREICSGVECQVFRQGSNQPQCRTWRQILGECQSRESSESLLENELPAVTLPSRPGWAQPSREGRQDMHGRRRRGMGALTMLSCLLLLKSRPGPARHLRGRRSTSPRKRTAWSRRHPTYGPPECSEEPENPPTYDDLRVRW